MPVHNGARYVRQSIDSVLGQNFVDFEFIIIDDGSRDETWEIINSYNDPRIRSFRNYENVGLPRTLNRGLSLTRGVYTARMDSDDICLPNRLTEQTRFLDEHSEIGLVGSQAITIDKDGNFSGILRYPETDGYIRWSLCFLDPIIHPTVMMRSKLAIESGGYSVDSKADDYDLWCRMSDRTCLANLPNTLLLLRKHDANFTQVWSADVDRDAIRVSQRVLGQILHGELTLENVSSLWHPQVASLPNAMKAIDTVCQLHRTFSRDSRLTSTEQRLISCDAVARIFGIAWVQRSITVIDYAIRKMREINSLVVSISSLDAEGSLALRKEISERQYALARNNLTTTRIWFRLLQALAQDPDIFMRTVRNGLNYVRLKHLPRYAYASAHGYDHES